MKVKIYGAGSIGNHLANASRRLGWAVDVVDIDPVALKRMSNEIYPARYGNWDESISTYLSGFEPKGGYDIILIGSPPDSHIKLAAAAVEEKPRAVLVEKPVCGLDMDYADALLSKAKDLSVKLFVGYDHAVSEAYSELLSLVSSKSLLGASVEVSFREFWGGIFEAHPWLDGPADSYLGFANRGGGALAEHSHGLHLLLTSLEAVGGGNIISVKSTINYFSRDGLDYDELSEVIVKTQNGNIGRCVQDVVTSPVKKVVEIFSNEWSGRVSFSKESDVLYDSYGPVEGRNYKKTRPDDFILELKHLQRVIDLECGTLLSIENGLKVMLVIKAAHLSAKTQREISIDWSAGFNDQALRVS